MDQESDRADDDASGVDAPLIRVLVIEDDPEAGFLTEANLLTAGHAVTVATSMHEAMHRIERGEAADVVVLDLGLPDIDGLPGITAMGEHSDRPVVVYTADARPETRTAATRLGAASFLVKGDATAGDLDEAVRAAAARSTDPERVTARGLTPFTSPDEAIAASLSTLANVTGLPEWALIRTVGTVDVVLVRHGDGPELRPGTATTLPGKIPRGAVVLEGDPVAEAGDDVLSPPVAVRCTATDGQVAFGSIVGWSTEPTSLPPATLELTELVARSIVTRFVLDRARAQAVRRADIAGNAAAIDTLTGLANRRAFDVAIRSTEAQIARNGGGAVVIVIDLDGLKQINDTQGHSAGDRYLRTAGAALALAIRGGDTVFRLGGDEFAILAPHSDPEATGGFAARLDHALEASGVRASIGWAARPPLASLEEAAKAADAAMYAEKLRRKGASESTGSGTTAPEPT